MESAAVPVRCSDSLGEKPFTPAELDGAGKPQVLFLRAPLPNAASESVQALAPDDERLVVSGREIHWLPAAGTSDSAIDLKALAELAGVHTMRTANTVARLAKKFL